MGIRARKNKSGTTYEVNFTYKEYGITKRYFKGGFRTKKEAKEHEIMVKAEIEKNGKLKKEVNLTLNEVFDEFMSVADSEFQENSVRTMKYCRSYFEDTIGKMPIREIRHIHLQNYFDSRKNEGFEQNKKIRKALRNTFKHARRNEYIEFDPLQDVKVKGIEHHVEKKPVTDLEFFRIIDEIKNYNNFKYDSYVIALKLGYYLGLRVSEACALEKKDFDLENAKVSINKKLVYSSLKNNEIHATHEMKSKSSKAILNIPEVLIDDLYEWFSINPYEKVICNENGEYINPNIMGNAIRKISRKLGIDFHYHLLRHTLSTKCYFDGIEPKVAQELLRHANIGTTLNIYTHSDETKQKQAINKVFSSKCGVNVA